MTTPPQPREAPVGYATLRQAAAYTGLSVRTLRRARAAGELGGRRVRGRVLVSYRALDDWIAGRS